MSKHIEVRKKYFATRRIFNSLLGVWKFDETLSLVFDILHETIFQLCCALKPLPKDMFFELIRLLLFEKRLS